MKWFLFLITMFSITYAYQNDALINYILANESDCVQSYENEKIYLNSDIIRPAKDGLFLDINGIPLVLRKLVLASSDSH